MSQKKNNTRHCHIIIIFLLSISLLSSRVESSSSCIAYSNDGTTYMDLSSLSLPNEEETQFYEQYATSGDEFYFNICGAVTSQYCESKQNTAVCQHTALQTPFSFGVTTSMSLIMLNDTSSMVSYSGGDLCTGSPRSSSVYITCNHENDETLIVGEAIESMCSASLYITTNKCTSRYVVQEKGEWLVWISILGLMLCIAVVMIFILFAVFLCANLFKKQTNYQAGACSAGSTQYSFSDYPPSSFGVDNNNNQVATTYYYPA